MKFHVNADCIGCGLCVSTCPEVFTMTDGGTAAAAPADVTGPDEAAATKMAASGLPPEVVKQILGHADIATTLNIYTHPDTALLVANLEKIQWR